MKNFKYIHIYNHFLIQLLISSFLYACNFLKRNFHSLHSDKIYRFFELINLEITIIGTSSNKL